jgi:hypothetical protein
MLYVKPSQDDISPSCLQEIIDLLETVEQKKEAVEILDHYGVIYE